MPPSISARYRNVRWKSTRRYGHRPASKKLEGVGAILNNCAEHPVHPNPGTQASLHGAQDGSPEADVERGSASAAILLDK